MFGKSIDDFDIDTDKVEFMTWFDHVSEKLDKLDKQITAANQPQESIKKKFVVSIFWSILHENLRLIFILAKNAMKN